MKPRHALTWGPSHADAASVIDIIRRASAGHSAERKYNALARAWRRRFFGRRFSAYFWTIYCLLAILVIVLHPSRVWLVPCGIGFGAACATWLLLPYVFMPASIFNWQRGAWGEQNTASELKRLRRAGWVVAHDVRWGTRGNHDHVVAGPAVYVLNSKNVKDSVVTIERKGVRVEHIDTEDSYLADRWASSAEREARSLKIELARMLGFPVHVYPVVVIWGRFGSGQQYIGDVSLVRGDKLADWLIARPVDLFTLEKREAVAQVVRGLPQA